MRYTYTTDPSIVAICGDSQQYDCAIIDHKLNRVTGYFLIAAAERVDGLNAKWGPGEWKWFPYDPFRQACRLARERAEKTNG